ncbi:hypothetical protein DESC_120131 [Desulfosarcina cetonica]|nr:hypothetical protein DESC_120131 [Desulfosarcina cetonica]
MMVIFSSIPCCPLRRLPGEAIFNDEKPHPGKDRVSLALEFADFFDQFDGPGCVEQLTPAEADLENIRIFGFGFGDQGLGVE